MKSFSIRKSSEKRKSKVPIQISQEENTTAPDLQRKTSLVSFKDVPEDNHEVKMRDVSHADANVRLTTGSTLSTTLSTDDDSHSHGCHEFNEAEKDEIRKNKANYDDHWFHKSRRHLTKTEKKLRREQAMQRK